MAHFAELDENGRVLRVLVVSNDDAPDPAPDNEAQGIAFLASLGLGDNWRQTSYSGSFRGKYAAIGDIYDPAADVFTEAPE